MDSRLLTAKLKIRVASVSDECDLTFSAKGGVLVSTECLMRWLHVEVDRLAS